MPSRQESRAEETKRAILAAASQLFAQRGFENVTIREIAKSVGCSHTTIYIYFKDKEALLHQLSMEPLTDLRRQMEAVLEETTRSPEERLRSITRHFLQFCFLHRNMYTIFFMVQSTRVDEEEPALEVNKTRNQLFGLLRQAVQATLPAGQSDELVLAYARIYFYTLHGIVGTYTDSEEPCDTLMERLAPTFDLAVDVLLSGFKQTSNMGVDRL